MMGGIVEVTIVDKPNQNTDDSNYSGEHVAEGIQFLFERCSFRYL
jgi:hypothetical protein